ncbi:hypothetical protein [Calycomorphotria hydatis]|nr:hypothetical protein [Calycomorphotria hydatis]
MRKAMHHIRVHDACGCAEGGVERSGNGRVERMHRLASCGTVRSSEEKN